MLASFYGFTVALMVALCFVFLVTAEERERVYELNITNHLIDPDCSGFTTPTLLVNQQLPGPPLVATRGDRVRIVVRNMLLATSTGQGNMTTHGGETNEMAIHYHGVRQYGSSNADGVPFVTQAPIPPGGAFVHEFNVVNQAGTYFYHAHVGLQEMTVFGPFIIYEDERADPEQRHDRSTLSVAGYEYDDERTISISEWWHRARTEFEAYFMGPQFTLIPEADSVLINGRTVNDATNVKTNGTCGGYSTIDVEPGKTYRLRVIGSTTFRTLGFAIAQHSFTIIEVDGEIVKPYVTNTLEVAPGQRFSVLLHADQPVGDYTIGTVRRWAESVNPYSNGFAVLRYRDAQPSFRARRRRAVIPAHDTNHTISHTVAINQTAAVMSLPTNAPEFSPQVPGWIWSELEPYYGVDPVSRKSPSRTLKLRAHEKVMPDNSTRWFINNVAYMDPKTTILADIVNRRRMPRQKLELLSQTNGYDAQLTTYPLEYFEIVDFVLQNTHLPGMPCRSHPWHTHGHSHWEIATGPGEYIEQRDGHIRNSQSPIHRDITLQYPAADEPSSNATMATDGEHAIGCGWTKIRIIADNPGVWAMHCHNTPHMLMGMMVVLEEAAPLIPTMGLSSSYRL